MQPLIRPRTDADLDACVDALALVHASDRYPVRWPPDARRFLCPADTLAGWVAAVQDEIVGHVLVRATPAHTSVSRLFVSPRARGNRLGERLLQVVVDWTAGHGRPLVLEVADNGSAAIALYERMGWRRTGTELAHWITANDDPVYLHSYVLPREA